MAKKFVSLDRLGTFLDQVKKLIPTVNNPTITIKQAGTQKGTFTLNQSGSTTIELTDNNTTYSAATTSANGLMSSSDKSKLDGIAAGATKVTVDTALSSSSTNPVQNKVINTALNSKANTSHTHNYAGSSSAGGVANSAAKLSTARTLSANDDYVMSMSFDGSANVTTNLRAYNATISVGNTNNYPFHRFAKIDTITSDWTDKVTNLLVTQDYTGGNWGICRIVLRTNQQSASAVSSVSINWLVRYGFGTDAIQIGLYTSGGKTYADAFLKTTGAYAGTVIRNLGSGARGGVGRTWTFINSSEVSDTTTSSSGSSVEAYATIANAGTTLHSQAYTSIVSGNDVGTTNYSNSAGSASSATKATQDSAGQQINTTYIKGLSVSGQTITYTKGDGLTGTIKTQDTNTTYSTATTSANGLMSSTDKSKLDGIAANANNYTHPTTSGNKHIPSGGSSGQILRWSADGTAAWGADNNTTYSAATTSAAGLMSAADKVKLDGITAGATKITVDSALSTTSTNPVQNKVIAALLDGVEDLLAAI